ncbi:MAG TPA: hypothetical protein VLE73_04190 [Candidatus Saccharimonadales bacterium]|nr:hypothetical protein [Candidatus Saccharimonadales bacterium]
MTVNNKSFWVFAYRHEGEYVPEEIVGAPEDRFANLEYGDVKEGSYQLWEYPSGKIFNIAPDRELGKDEDYYATPYNNKGSVWLPKLVEVGVDQDRVAKAYSGLKV